MGLEKIPSISSSVQYAIHGNTSTNREQLDFYSDSSRNFELGFGAHFENDWMVGRWDTQFCEQKQPSIAYLELFAVTAAVL